MLIVFGNGGGEGGAIINDNLSLSILTQKWVLIHEPPLWADVKVKSWFISEEKNISISKSFIKSFWTHSFAAYN